MANGLRKLVAPVLLVGAAAGLLGLARAESKMPSRGVLPIAYTHNRLKQALDSAPSDPQAVLESVLRRYGGTRVLDGSIEERTAPRPAGTVLHFTIAANGTGEEAIRGQWESDLVAGAVADQLAGSPQRVVSTIIDARLPNGDVHPDLVGGMGNIVANQSFSTPTDDAIRLDVTGGLEKSGLGLISLDVLRAAQPAPAVIAETSDPLAAAAAARETIRSLFGQNPPKYEGYYFEVRDSGGDPVLIQAAAFRTGAGRLWFTPKVANVLSLNYLGSRRR